jgi:predicted nucleotidyltransferase component of viral defense system
MLDPTERDAVAEAFGVADVQVRRDHLISHLLAALSRALPDAVTFFGGTALARTHLPDGRLSEDLDLIAVGSRARVVSDVESTLASSVRRTFGRLTWTPPLTSVRDVDPAVLTTADGLTVRVQLLDPVGCPPWPIESHVLTQRYSDAPPARLRVPTLQAFVAMKTTAWADRHAARDLFDLYGLARHGAVDAEALGLYLRHGPTGRPPADWLFDEPPTEQEWRDQLGGQTRLSVGSAEAAAVVRDAWADALSRHQHPQVQFRDGPAGRRARLVGGPDVWEVIRAVHSARTAEPDLSEDEIVTLVVETGGVAEHLVHAALDYWADHPDDVDAWIARNDEESQAARKRVSD